MELKVRCTWSILSKGFVYQLDQVTLQEALIEKVEFFVVQDPAVRISSILGKAQKWHFSQCPDYLHVFLRKGARAAIRLCSNIYFEAWIPFPCSFVIKTTSMNTFIQQLGLLAILFFPFIPNLIFGQTLKTTPTKELEKSSPIAVIEHVLLQLQDKTNWNQSSTFEEVCDLERQKQSLRCAIRKAQIELTGTYEHRNALMRTVRREIGKHFFCRQGMHPIDGFNKHSKTTHEDILFLLEEVKKQFLKRGL